jgi:hypothetical protein
MSVRGRSGAEAGREAEATHAVASRLGLLCQGGVERGECPGTGHFVRFVFFCFGHHTRFVLYDYLSYRIATNK